MTGYVIFFIEDISDPEKLERYKQAAFPTIVAAGGSATIVNGQQEVVEGAPIKGVVTIAFPTYEAARDWYHSPAYQAASAIRKHAARVQAVIVEGR